MKNKIKKLILEITTSIIFFTILKFIFLKLVNFIVKENFIKIEALPFISALFTGTILFYISIKNTKNIDLKPKIIVIFLLFFIYSFFLHFIFSTIINYFKFSNLIDLCISIPIFVLWIFFRFITKENWN